MAKIKLLPGNPAFHGQGNGFYTGEAHHPATVQLLKHCKAVHNTQQPVDDCPACTDILKKITRTKVL